MAKPPKMQTVYHNMEFPDYEFREFPKWVTGPDGVAVEVQDEAEEAKVLASEPVVREADERARLVKIAQTKGVTFDRRWGFDKLRQAISDAGHDPDMNPDA